MPLYTAIVQETVDYEIKNIEAADEDDAANVAEEMFVQVTDLNTIFKCVRERESTVSLQEKSE